MGEQICRAWGFFSSEMLSGQNNEKFCSKNN